MPSTRNPLISVIIPTYNHGKFIGETIRSALSQTHDNIEIIVIDNYSEDDTEKIVSSFQNTKIKYKKFRNNGIIAASRNEGVKIATGEYIAFLDSDDLWANDKLEKQLSHIANNPGLMGISSDMKIDSTMGYTDPQFGTSPQGFIDYDYHKILEANPIATSSVLIRRADFLATNGFDESPDFRFIEDWELWLRMARKGNFRVMGEKLITYRIYPTTRDKAEVTKRKLKILEKQCSLGFVKDNEISEIKANIYLILAFQLLVPDNRESRRYFAMTINNTKKLKLRSITILAILLTFLPLFLRKAIYPFLQKFNRS
jgi:glycosyltransferase involved in cell wall biosynthesis